MRASVEACFCICNGGLHGAKWLDGQRGGVGLINQAWRWQVAVVR